jgi:hypothetical protein
MVLRLTEFSIALTAFEHRNNASPIPSAGELHRRSDEGERFFANGRTGERRP